MCDCEICFQWLSDARNHPKHLLCKNKNHCVCCITSKGCVGCNHHNVPLDNRESIHYHGKRGINEEEHDWIVVQRTLPQIQISCKK